MDGIGVIREIPSQRYTVLHIDTSASDCLVHDAMYITSADEVFSSVYSYRHHCGQ